MRVRVVLAVGLALVACALVLDMSGSAPRTAGTDHENPAAFVATLAGGQELCQSAMVLPTDAARLKVLVGTYGAQVPPLDARFLGPGNRVIATGRLVAGAHQGDVDIPISYPHGPAAAGTLCIHVGGHIAKAVLGGEGFAAGPVSEHVDGAPQPGRVAVTYVRPGSESWWQLFPTLSRRFGLGKASFFGTWSLLAAAVALAAVWVAVVRLLLRELP